MTKEQLQWYVGCPAYITPAPGMRVAVVIKDTKTAYGKLRVLLTPATGEGEAWYNLDNVELPTHIPTRPKPTPIHPSIY